MKEVLSTEEASPTNDTGMNPGFDAFSSSTHSECKVPIIFHLSWHSSIKLFELRIVDPCIL